MTGFTADWLSLREPADAAARDVALTARLAEMARQRSPARFIDLGCGTGANLRYLAPRIDGPQEWLMVDRDNLLLAQIRGATQCQVETRCIDLATGLDALEIAADAVVTASALLDLVSDLWLMRLIEGCHAGGAIALFALSYDGRMNFTPSDIDDEWIRLLVNRHQLGDKGFGPALGPEAATRVCERFMEVDYDVQRARSDWNLDSRDRLLQRQLIEGWARAAAEVVAVEAMRCQKWLERRLAHVAHGTSRITVGHQDVLAWPR
jgi:SAM-dependent methyltransferase